LPTSLDEWREYRAVESLIARGADLDAKDDDIDGDLRLHRAASNGHAAVVQLLIENQANVDVRNGYGYTALHYAAMSGNSRTAELLLDAGAYAEAHIDTTEMYTRPPHQLKITPLHLAAWHGKMDIVRLLLARGAKVDAATRGYITPLHFAAGGGHLKMVELLITHGADPLAKTPNNTNALHFAASGGTLVVECRYGWWDAMVFPDDALGELPYVRMLTAHCGDEHGKIINLLLARGAKINQTGAFGFAPLHFAAHGLCLSAVDTLIKAGAELTTGAAGEKYDPPGWPKGTTALHLAADPLKVFKGDCSEEIIDALIRAGASVDATDKYGITPLHKACHGERPESIRQLLAAGADVNAPSTSFPSEDIVNLQASILYGPSIYHPDDPHLCIMTPLMAAMLSSAARWFDTLEKAPWEEPLFKEAERRNVTKCKQRPCDSVAILLKNGADVKAALPNGETVLHVATARSDGAPLVKMLIDAGADINAKTENGVTPLHYAAMNKGTETLKILLASGADPNAKAMVTKICNLDMLGTKSEEVIDWPPEPALIWAERGKKIEAVKLLAPVTKVDYLRPQIWMADIP